MKKDSLPTDYAIDPSDAQGLLGFMVMPTEERTEQMLRLFKDDPQSAISLFSNFMGMAISVVENNRLALTHVLDQHGIVVEDQSDHFNLPDLAGASMGTSIVSMCFRMCDGCAFRHGTVANQCSSTVFDASLSVENGDAFLCHDEATFKDGKPSQACRGWTNERARHLMAVHARHVDVSALVKEVFDDGA